MKNNKFRHIIINRYSDKEFSKNYYNNSKSGLKDYEKILVNKFLKKAKNILVVGCGCGREVIPLAKENFNVTAIDISEEMVKQTKRLCKEFNVKAKVFQMDATDLNFKPESFDAVLLLNSIIDQIPTHANRKRLSKGVYTVIKHGGICIVVSNNALYPGEKFCYWVEHIKEILPYLANRRQREFFDRIYNDKNQQVYVHLSTPNYLKHLFRHFKIVLFSSTDRLQGGDMDLVTNYFAPNLVMVAVKEI
ncbi:MAG: class I SAM-dependent methyltransferase [archaeon]